MRGGDPRLSGAALTLWRPERAAALGVLVPLIRFGERVWFTWFGICALWWVWDCTFWRGWPLEKVASASICFSFSGHVEEQI